jgi:hypothetical protein
MGEMTTLRVQRWLLGAAVVAAAMASGRGARAARQDEGNKDTAKEGGSASATVTLGGNGASASVETAEKGEKKDTAEKKEEKGEEEETPFSFDFDFVAGSAKEPAIVQTMPGNALSPNPTYQNYTPRVSTYSFILSGGWEFTKGFGVGVRVPVELGQIFTPDSKGTGGVGNIELEAEGELHLAKNLELELGLGVALPTAQGAEFDPAAPVVVAGTIDQGAYDKYTIQKATMASRGYEDNALYETRRFGLIPKIKLEWGEHGKWHVDPWIKLENLMSTNSAAEHSYIGELVFGANAGVHVLKQFEPGLRIWANAPLANADFTAVAVVEPELRFHFGDVSPMVGVILPIAGPLTSPYDIGVRMAVATRF